MKWYLILILAITNVCYGVDVLPAPGDIAIENGEKWYKWNTENFIILSLNEAHGDQLAGQIEGAKRWLMTRWGLPNVPFVNKSKIVCVPTDGILKQLFGLNQSYAEIKRGARGRIEGTSCWFVYGEHTKRDLPVLLTEICLSELEQYISDTYKTNYRICYWAKRGIAILNSDIDEVKLLLSSLQDQNVFLSNTLFIVSKERVLRSSADSILLYDKESAMLCLMIRREFGQSALLSLMVDGSENNLYSVIGFKSYQDFDSTFKRYIHYAASDIATGRMPDKYLQVTNVQNWSTK